MTQQIHISDKAWKHLSMKKIEMQTNRGKDEPKKYPNFADVVDHELFGEKEVEEE